MMMLQIHSNSLFIAVLLALALYTPEACPYLQAQAEAEEVGVTRKLRLTPAMAEGPAGQRQLQSIDRSSMMSRFFRDVRDMLRGRIGNGGSNNGGGNNGGGNNGGGNNGGGNNGGGNNGGNVGFPQNGVGGNNGGNNNIPQITYPPVTGLTTDQALAAARLDIASILDGNRAAKFSASPFMTVSEDAMDASIRNRPTTLALTSPSKSCLALS